MAQEKENQGVVTFAGNPVTLLGELIKVGDTAPEFTATGEGLKPVRLSDFKGKTVILSSHLLQEVESFIDACIFLREGRLLYDGEFSRLRELLAQRLRALAPGPSGAAGGASPPQEYRFAHDDGRRIVVDPATRTDSGASGAEPGLEPVDGATLSLQTAYAWLSHRFETSGAEGWEPPR